VSFSTISGESGPGKSIMSSATLKDISPVLTVLDGEILYKGVDQLNLIICDQLDNS
jgi:ABC-type dipeptide/oligopeptide/nickel transport system ATPase component